MADGCEIERKFLISKPLDEILRDYPSHRKLYIEQCYLTKTGEWTTRVRKVTIGNNNSEHWLTLKRKISDVSCTEVETPIDEYFYNKVVRHCGPPLRKIRHELEHDGELWEVDLFTQPELGFLVVAEIELDHEDEVFTKPDWLGEEVTNDKQYKNVKLARRLTEE